VLQSGARGLAKAYRRRNLHVSLTATACTSTSTESEGGSSEKCLSQQEKGLAFTQLFQLRLGPANYCALFLEYLPETYLAGLGASRI
jgi:hypothetical protein